MATVNIENVKKSYGATDVLHGVSVDISDGEFVILVGPSGCGKSTLLRMIAGLETITGGDVRIGERIVNRLAPKERDIAMVFQSYALYPHMTVSENMGFSLKLAGRKKFEIDAEVRKAAEMLDLELLLDRLPKQLSGGQRQRVAMGRAIVRKPQVFLFDEPLSNLDAKLRVQMRSQIKALHQRLKTTTIYVTHDQVEAMTMADRIVIMNGGRVEQVGPPIDLYDFPNNLFVASFIGSPGMNLLNGEIIEKGSEYFFKTEGNIWVPCGTEVPASALNRPLVLGVRPEHVVITSVDAGVPAEVSVVEPTGAETQVTVKVDGSDIIAFVRDRVEMSVGDSVGLSFTAGKLHFFDQGSGLRLF